ncbi:MAG TPA: hypothetical protein PKL15_01370 [Saprospiraceae bacterium]|nr:hypothetical protein [Saprospiraceae bacterium]
MKVPAYMGYRPEDYLTPHARFFADVQPPLPEPARLALDKGALPAGALPPPERAAELLQAGYWPFETGYTLEPDGSQHVAVLTRMPGVQPTMWHWWFGWHGNLASRYKLWHPKAHRDARWADGEGDLGRYIGRTSLIEEYIGASMEKAAIRFIPPAELGLPEANEAIVCICARVGYSRYPIDFGWLVHELRAIPGGAEMRSRFWMGGRYIQLRKKGRLAALASSILQKTIRLPEKQARELLTHCAEEMNHLASFLPALYSEFHPGVQS